MLDLNRQNQYREYYRQRNPAWQPSGEVLEAWVCEHLQPASSWLDVGCGRGGLPEKLASSHPRLVGVDPDWLSLHEYRQPRVARAVAQGEALPFAAESFDLLLAVWVFEHLPNPAATLCEFARVLRPGGKLIFITPNAQNPLVALNRINQWLSQWLPRMQAFLVPKLYGRAEADTFPVQYCANTAEQLRQLAQACALRLVRLQSVADPTYLAFHPWLFELAQWVSAGLPNSAYIHWVGIFQKPEAGLA
jgi:SAM-dependent methyltransferase